MSIDTCVYDSLGPISRLPAEILLQIFQCCTRRPDVEEANWLAFSHVCRQWYHLAVAESSLWTYPDFERPKLAQAMINRARSRPLHLTVRHSCLLFSLIDGRRNVEAFNVLLTGTDCAVLWQEETTRYLSGSFPVLETLDLRSFNQAFLADFPDLNAPRLASVTLHNWSPSWNHSYMRNLTTLSVVIEAVGFDRHAPAQPPKLFDVLKRSPGLVNLTLEGVVWRRDLELPEPGASDRLQLRHLKHLELKDDVALIDRLLRILELPALESLAIRAELCTENATPELLALCGALRGLLCSPQWMTLETMSWGLGPSTRIKFWNESGVNLSFRVIEDIHPSELKAFSKTLILSLPLAHLKIVKVHVSDPSSKPLLYLWMALSTLPEITTIDFKGPGCRAFEGLLNSFVPAFTLPGLKSRTEEPFPALQRLTLSSLKMYRKISDHSALFWQLDAFLICRKQRDRPVPDVTLIGCTFAMPLPKLWNGRCRVLRPRVILASSSSSP